MNGKKIVRNDGRTPDQLRPVSFSRDIYEYAAGSYLFEMGKTKILCAVSMQTGVPQFLRGKGAGWLTAEYALLPTSTLTRTQRESTLNKRDGRAIEIARFIGRCFRSIVDLSVIGERTITIDCDVLQADGGTRTAAITGSFMALMLAQERWLKSRIISKPIIIEKMVAISVGVVDQHVFLDLNYEEDSAAQADFNFVITDSNKIIEMQGGAEKSSLSWETFEQIRTFAEKGAQELIAFSLQSLDAPIKQNSKQSDSALVGQSEKVPLFSLKNRFQSSQ